MPMTTTDIINAISQVVTQYGHDGALTDDQKPVEIGLKREEGHPILDSRVIDGFKVKFYGDKLCIHYTSECKLKDVHDKKFESEVESKIKDVAKFIRKEYKKVTGKSLSLSETEKPFVVDVQNVSRVRSSLHAEKEYKIGGLGGTVPVEEDEAPTVDNAIKNWLSFAKKTPKPENVSIKPSDNEKPGPYKKKRVD